jgi:hypothetical protein
MNIYLHSKIKKDKGKVQGFCLNVNKRTYEHPIVLGGKGGGGGDLEKNKKKHMGLGFKQDEDE